MTNKMYSCSDEDFKKLVAQSYTAREVKQALGYSNCGGNTDKLFNFCCKELGIDLSHFNPVRNRDYIIRNEENVFCVNSTADSETLRRWYKKGNYQDYKCSICGLTEWNNEPITLRLDHINGINNDNRLENLRWLCPNCDSQSEFYCGRNSKNRKNRHTCSSCGKIIDKSASLCIDCYEKQTKVYQVMNSISREEFKKDLREKTLTEIANNFSIGRNTLRKVCSKLNLPDTKEKINSFSDKEWENI